MAKRLVRRNATDILVQKTAQIPRVRSNSVSTKHVKPLVIKTTEQTDGDSETP